LSFAYLEGDAALHKNVRAARMLLHLLNQQPWLFRGCGWQTRSPVELCDLRRRFAPTAHLRSVSRRRYEGHRPELSTCAQYALLDSFLPRPVAPRPKCSSEQEHSRPIATLPAARRVDPHLPERRSPRMCRPAWSRTLSSLQSTLPATHSNISTEAFNEAVHRSACA